MLLPEIAYAHWGWSCRAIGIEWRSYRLHHNHWPAPGNHRAIYWGSADQFDPNKHGWCFYRVLAPTLHSKIRGFESAWIKIDICCRFWGLITLGVGSCALWIYSATNRLWNFGPEFDSKTGPGRAANVSGTVARCEADAHGGELNWFWDGLPGHHGPACNRHGPEKKWPPDFPDRQVGFPDT